MEVDLRSDAADGPPHAPGLIPVELRDLPEGRSLQTIPLERMWTLRT
jgi:hypothetical protein